MVLTPPRLPRARRNDDEGLVAVITALVVVLVVMPLLALVVDLGLTRAAGGQARVAADAAALAAAAQQRDAAGVAAAVEAAHRLGRENFGVKDDQWASCVDQNPLPAGTLPSPGNCVSFDLTAKQVRVTVPARRVPGVFSGVLGSSPPAASATSVASWGAFAQPCTLCVIGSYDGGVQQLEVRGGDVAVGGDLTVGRGAALVTDPGRTVGVGGTVTAGGDLRTTPVPGGVPTDPFASQLAALAALPAAGLGSVSAARPADAARCTPGTYQDVSDCQAFDPGVYVLTGAPQPDGDRFTITLRGSGSGVVFYVTCSTPSFVFPVRPLPCSAATSSQPRINVPPAGSTTLGGHPAYAGLVLAFDPSAGATQRFTGNGTLTLNGSIDGPAVTLRDPTTASPGRVVVSGGRVVVGAVLYQNPAASPVHPYLTVQAPTAEPLPDGPVRLVPSS